MGVVLAALAVLPLLAAAQSCYGGNTIAGSNNVMPNGKYQIASEGIRANFIPYGASLSNLFITDVHGVERDIVLGFDNATYYTESKMHPHLCGVPGRYANRIKNGTFTIDGETFHTNLNDNGGLDTLHGGADGWDYRNWTVVAHTTDSITFNIVDPDGKEGFPGQVIAYVTYTVQPYQWHLKMTALSTTKKTPILLDGFQNPSTPLALNYSLYLPYAGTRIAIDNIEIPTGDILANKQYSVNDFWSAPKQLGANITSPSLLGNCGYNCTGYDTCYIQNRDAYGPYNWRQAPVATLASPFSGTFAIKETQGFFNDSSRPRVAEKYGCVVMEVEDWIDGINNPEWGRDKKQIFGPGDDPYVLEATYNFSLNHTLAATFDHTATS
ncbi:hypothetical protein LTR36_005779 [Oleoguttula mirabilis]|uniref:Aldose 1-epimerase n=1 Tax=Oleoguttula mirabilis TaxID=1507867 RepID=A0AAV9JDJ9_9PEZI|nr:hypothetical protein LTR36_005779 [Oleoguttula mirabilis]